VAQEHDVDQRNEFPEERRRPLEEQTADGVDERDGDRQRDEHHHPRLAVLEFRPGHREERHATVREDDHRKNRRDPDASGERRRCVAEDILNELAEEDDWHRERERYPEPPPEHPLVTRVIGVGPVIFVLSLVNVRAVVVVVFVPQYGRG